MAGAEVTLNIVPITREAFAPFGKVIDFSPVPEDERFEIIVREEVEPWRIAVFRVRQRTAARLECHPASMESFEPMRGTGVLLVAEPRSPENVHAFLLDRPVCLYKGVWHEVMALSDEALYKITENKAVHSEFYELKTPATMQVTLSC